MNNMEIDQEDTSKNNSAGNISNPVPELPPEMWNGICQFLPRGDLHRATLINRAVGAIARERLETIFIIGMDKSKKTYAFANDDFFNLYENLQISTSEDHIFTSFAAAQDFWAQTHANFSLVEVRRVVSPFKRESLKVKRESLKESDIVGIYSKNILILPSDISLENRIEQNPYTCMRNGNLFIPRINSVIISINRAIAAHKKDIETLTAAKKSSSPAFFSPSPNLDASKDEQSNAAKTSVVTSLGILVKELEGIKQKYAGSITEEKKVEITSDITKAYEAAAKTMKSSGAFKIQRLLYQGLKFIGLNIFQNLFQNQVVFDSVKKHGTTLAPSR